MISRFISFEGIDGSGKSTQIKLLTDWLDKKNIEFIVVREPGSSKISENIRDILLDKKNTASLLRSDEWYKKNNINLLNNKNVIQYTHTAYFLTFHFPTSFLVNCIHM